MRRLISAVLLAAALSGGAKAASFDAVSSFTGVNPSGAFSYGSGIGGLSFTPFASPAAYTLDPNLLSFGFLPGVGKNTSSGSINAAGTTNIPNTVLWLHPGNATLGDDAIVRFTAPQSGAFHLTGAFSRLSNASNPYGNGVNVGVSQSALSLFAATIPETAPTNGPVPFTLSGFITAGQSIDFYVNNRGTYSYDSTGLALTVDIPEPVSLAVFGIGLLGMALVRRNMRG